MKVVDGESRIKVLLRATCLKYGSTPSAWPPTAFHFHSIASHSDDGKTTLWQADMNSRMKFIRIIFSIVKGKSDCTEKLQSKGFIRQNLTYSTRVSIQLCEEQKKKSTNSLHNISNRAKEHMKTFINTHTYTYTNKS